MNEVQSILSRQWSEIGEIISNHRQTRNELEERFNGNRRLQIIRDTPAFTEFLTAIELEEQEYNRLQPLVENWLREDNQQQQEFNEILSILRSMQDSIERSQTLLSSISNTVED